MVFRVLGSPLPRSSHASRKFSQNKLAADILSSVSEVACGQHILDREGRKTQPFPQSSLCGSLLCYVPRFLLCQLQKTLIWTFSIYQDLCAPLFTIVNKFSFGRKLVVLESSRGVPLPMGLQSCNAFNPVLENICLCILSSCIVVYC